MSTSDWTSVDEQDTMSSGTSTPSPDAAAAPVNPSFFKLFDSLSASIEEAKTVEVPLAVYAVLLVMLTLPYAFYSLFVCECVWGKPNIRALFLQSIEDAKVSLTLFFCCFSLQIWCLLVKNYVISEVARTPAAKRSWEEGAFVHFLDKTIASTVASMQLFRWAGTVSATVGMLARVAYMLKGLFNW